jgi:hypothetical protein
MKTLYKNQRHSEPADAPRLVVTVDGVYIVTIVLVTIIFSIMIGAYL